MKTDHGVDAFEHLRIVIYATQVAFPLGSLAFGVGLVHEADWLFGVVFWSGLC